MKLEKIITLANKKSQIRFLAMERSLRATGCNLPLWVIPFDGNKFELPDNCIWWDVPEILSWTLSNKLWPAFRKIQCLTTTNYQFVDSDVVFLRNPELVLKDLNGFVTSCTHWNNAAHTHTTETLPFFKKKSTTWPKLMFNSGQWACDEKLYDLDELIHFCENFYVDTLFKKNYIYRDQPGINLLVNHTNISITNTTLPPIGMQSSWAGHYENERYGEYWLDEAVKPYIIHWAGTRMDTGRPIDELFLQYLTTEEKLIWDKQVIKKASTKYSLFRKLKQNTALVVNTLKNISFD